MASGTDVTGAPPTEQELIDMYDLEQVGETRWRRRGRGVTDCPKCEKRKTAQAMFCRSCRLEMGWTRREVIALRAHQARLERSAAGRGAKEVRARESATRDLCEEDFLRFVCSEHGLTEDDVLLVCAVLSRCIGSYDSENLAIFSLNQVLARYAGVSAPTPDGAMAPPLVTEALRHYGWSSEETARKVLRRKRKAAERAAAEARAAGDDERARQHRALAEGLKKWDLFRPEYKAFRSTLGAHARFAPTIVAEYVSPDLWPAVLGAITDGPALAAARLAIVFEDFIEMPVPPDRRSQYLDENGMTRYSKGTMATYATVARRLFAHIHALYQAGYRDSRVRAWTYAPDVRNPKVPKRGRKTVAPRREKVRETWQDCNLEIHERLGVHRIEDEREVLEGMSADRMRKTGLYKRYRNRVLRMLYPLLGGRLSAMASLTRGDFHRDWTGCWPDFRSGFCLEHKPRKGFDEDEVHPKPLPNEAGPVIDNFLYVVDRLVDHTYDHPNLRKFRPASRPVLTDEAPLIPATLNRPLKPFDRKAIGAFFAGKSTGGRGAQLAAIPRDPSHLPSHTDPLDHPYIGYTPHEYRHLAFQLALRAGRMWNADHPDVTSEAHHEPDHYAMALLDHRGNEKINPMAAVYGDRQIPEAYETLAGRAISLIWKLLNDEIGKRKTPDVDSYVATAHRIQAHIADVHYFADQSSQLARNELARQTPPMPPLPAGATDSAKIDHLIAVAHESLRREDELRQLLVASIGFNGEMFRRFFDYQHDVTHLHALRYDQRTWLRIPDSAPAGVEEIDWNDVDQAILGRPLDQKALPKPEDQVRDWLTAAEFREFAGDIHRSTLKAWRDGLLPDPPPWDRELGAPIDLSQGDNYARFWVGGINPDFWPSDDVRMAIMERLATWPKGKGWSKPGTHGEPTPFPRALEPLVLPASYAEQRTSG